MLVSRHDVYRAIDTERTYQDKGLGNAQRHENMPPALTVGEGILCMEECLAHARTAWYGPTGGTDCLPFIRKVAALGVQMMERYGAPERKPG